MLKKFRVRELKGELFKYVSSLKIFWSFKNTRHSSIYEAKTARRLGEQVCATEVISQQVPRSSLIILATRTVSLT